MDEDKFYANLWVEKNKNVNPEKSRRDWMHRLILDRVADPYKNDRIEIAAKLLSKGQRILDLGIWGGGFLNQESIRMKFEEYYGLDLPIGSVNAALNLGIRAQVWNLNKTPYPFPADYFDTVTLLAVLEHIFDPYSVMIEVVRLVRLGGEVVVCVPNVASFSNRLRLLMGKLPVTSLDPGWDGGHLHYFTISRTIRLLRDSGLKITGVDISGGMRGIRRLFPSLLAGEFLVKGVKTLHDD